MTEHAHHEPLPVRTKLKFSIVLTGCILAAEVAAGVLSNSLALLSDAGHVFIDLLALSLGWYGVKQAERPPSSRMTFGYHRVGVIIAIVNAVSIFAMAAFIFYQAYHRLQQAPEVNSLLMLSVAVVGLGANCFVALWLRREPRANLNVRSVFWHALGDALASVGVIAGGIIMILTGNFRVDPVISMLIGLIITFAGWRILKEGLRVLVEATPYHVDIVEMVNTMKQVPGVKDVHDVHVWSISPELHTMSCHVLIDDLSTTQASGIREKIEDVLRREFLIGHTTLQMECQQCSSNDLLCSLDFGAVDKEARKSPH